MKFSKLSTPIFLFIFLLSTQCSPPSPKTHYLKLGTNLTSTVYYSTGIIIADFINKNETSPKLDISVEPSLGTIANIENLSNGQIDLALVQADQQYQAYHGKGIWKNNPQNKLRFICSLHQETLALIAAEDSHIKSINDLIGKRVTIGSCKSSTQYNFKEVLSQKGIDPKKDLYSECLTLSESISKFDNKEIDAIFIMTGHPSQVLLELTSNPHRPAYFVPIEKMRALIKDSPYYTKGYIPIDFYPNTSNEKDVPTVSVITTLITTEDTSDEVVYELVKTIFQNIEKLKTKHPSFINLSKKSMLESAFSPIHPGAKKYYQELNSQSFPETSNSH
jgi:uncharacterized protein